MKITKRILAMLLAVILLISAAACGKKDEKEETTAEVQAENNVETEAKPTTKPDKGNTTAAFTDYLIAEKIGTLDRDNFAANNGGLTYKENNLTGIISYEGLYDTGAIYSYVGTEENYFIVRKSNPTSADDIATLNAAQIINGKGKAVIPGTFAAFNVISEKYILAVTATKRTTNSDNAIMTYRTDTNTTHTFISEGDICAWYEGSWCVYDITTGKPVPGVTGTKGPTVYASGDFITFRNDAGESISTNSNGVILPEKATLFSNGTYRIEEKIGNVYDCDGNLLFSYDVKDYAPDYAYEEYYVASKYENNTRTYAVMNKKGEILSEGYTESISLSGEFVLGETMIYNLNGNKLVEGKFGSIFPDKTFGNNWLLRNGDNYTMVDANGNVFLTENTNNTNIYSDDFLASKEKSDGTYFYSHKDKDYTIPGYSFAPWVVKTPTANSLYNLVDTMTGKTLLEGYNSYSKIVYSSNAYYVYAKYNGGTDVYLIISASNLDKVTQTKTNLYDDLAAAFAAEGLAITVDKVNGAIALDTAILFGGDSAALSAEGKEILNKFIKVYTGVIYSDKYKGFITKTLVEGHTAPLANSTYESGYSLSLERATNVMNYCLSAEAGTTAASPIANSLEAVGYSNSQPIYNDDGTVNLDASRRVSFRFMVNIEY